MGLSVERPADYAPLADLYVSGLTNPQCWSQNAEQACLRTGTDSSHGGACRELFPRCSSLISPSTPARMISSFAVPDLAYNQKPNHC